MNFVLVAVSVLAQESVIESWISQYAEAVMSAVSVQGGVVVEEVLCVFVPAPNSVGRPLSPFTNPSMPLSEMPDWPGTL